MGSASRPITRLTERFKGMDHRGIGIRGRGGVVPVRDLHLHPHIQLRCNPGPDLPGGREDPVRFVGGEGTRQSM